MKTRAELEAIFDNLNYPWEQFTIDHFIAFVEEKVRRRPMKLFSVPNLIQPWCASGPQVDFVFHSSTIGRAFQTHHKLHEIGHFVLGHVKIIKSVEDDSIADLLLRYSGHFRSAELQDDPQLMGEENEAEFFAYLVRQKVVEHNRIHELTSITTRTDLFLPPFSGRLSKRSESK